MIGFKLKYVLLPRMREDKAKELRNCKLDKVNRKGTCGDLLFSVFV
jgi:hypothetical protein